jgi:hypothetical protein
MMATYYPDLRSLLRGAGPSHQAFRHLNRILLEDYADLQTDILLLLLKMIIRITQQGGDPMMSGTDVTLYNAVHEKRIVATLLQLEAVQRDHPELATIADLPSRLATAKAISKQFKRWLSDIHDGELYLAVYEDLADSLVATVKQQHAAFLQSVKQRCNLYKEELIAAAWHPRRVESWLAAGVEIESL